MILNDKNSLVNIITKAFPSAKLSSLSIINYDSFNGFIFLMLFIAVNIIAFVLIMFLGEKLYFKGLIGLSQSTAKQVKISELKLEKISKQNSQIKTYIIKELRILFRTPAFFINCVITNFMWPIFLIIPFLTEITSNKTKFFKSIQMIRKFSDSINIYVVLVCFGAVVLLTITNGIASTAISREGKGIFVNKYIPMSYKKQLIAKIVPGIILDGVSILILFILGCIVLRPSLKMIAALLIITVLVLIVDLIIGILLDVSFPKLSWDDETKAVKQNFNVLINMAISVALAGLLIFIILKFGLSFVYGISLIIGVYFILSIILGYVLSTYGLRCLGRIE
jgi:ABC-2 type transport system permease protein